MTRRYPNEPLTNELLREYRGAMPDYVLEDAIRGDIVARRKAAALINEARISCVVRVSLAAHSSDPRALPDYVFKYAAMDAEAKPERQDPPWLDELLDALGWQGGTASAAIAAVRGLSLTDPNPPWLDELCDALGWQGGTSSAAIAAVRRLIAVEKEGRA